MHRRQYCVAKEFVVPEPKVLMVDDEEQIVKSFQRRLRQELELDIATSGKEGLAALREKGPYAVVVSDFRMPEMDGIEFLKRVREEAPDTVRIMLTGYADLPMTIQAVNQGQVFRFMTKPCPPRNLLQAIQHGIKYYKFIQAEREFIDLKRMRKSLEQIVFALVTLVESRDPYTSGHQQRVAQLSTAIAKEMGLDRAQVEIIKMAAIVHDIGKIYVPIDFLNKPGALREEEFNIIKLHPQVGCDILAPIDFEKPVGQMVLQHHERMNGSGYPQGLKGPEIMQEARIIAVADVVEAMCSTAHTAPAGALTRPCRRSRKMPVCFMTPMWSAPVYVYSKTRILTLKKNSKSCN